MDMNKFFFFLKGMDMNKLNRRENTNLSCKASAVNELSLGEPRLSKLAYLKISRAQARAELMPSSKI